VTPSSVAVGYRHFGKPCCVQHFTLTGRGSKVEVEVSYRKNSRRHNPQDLYLKFHSCEKLKSRKEFNAFMGSEVPSPYSQEHDTGPYPEANETCSNFRFY